MEKKDADTAFILRRMGEIQMNDMHEYSDATKRFLDALEILRGPESEKNDEEIEDLVLLIAQAYASAEDYENSLDYYEEHIKLLDSNDNPEDEDFQRLADSLFAMGNIFVIMKYPDYDLSIEKLLDCLDVKKQIYGTDDEQVSNVVHTLGCVTMSMCIH